MSTGQRKAAKNALAVLQAKAAAVNAPAAAVAAAQKIDFSSIYMYEKTAHLQRCAVFLQKNVHGAGNVVAI